MFSQFNLGELERALDTCSQRQAVISTNLANASNPDYQAKALVFEEEMRSVSKDGRRVFENQALPRVETVGGKVDIVSEMASLAKNQILYTAYADRAGDVFRNLNWIIDNSGR